MSRGTLTKVIGACCGLAAFAIAVVAGLSAENPGEVILFRALICMFFCQLVGLGIGTVVERVISDSIDAHKRTRPEPQEPGGSVGGMTAGVSAT